MEAWTVPAPGPGMTCLTAGPEETTPLQHHGAPGEGPGAQMMKAAAAGEEEEEEGGEEVEAGLTNLPVTLSTSLDRNQEDGGMNATLLAVAPVSSSEPSSCETLCDLFQRMCTPH